MNNRPQSQFIRLGLLAARMALDSHRRIMFETTPKGGDGLFDRRYDPHGAYLAVCPRCNRAMRWQCEECGTSGGKVPPAHTEKKP